jgi:hypothetical protein
MKKLYFLILLLFFSTGLLFSQVGVNTDGTSPDNCAMLDVKSDISGFLPPRVTIVQRDAITNPAEGLWVFCTDCGYNNSGAMSIFINGRWRLLTANCPLPQSPLAGTHVPSPTQIEWHWNTVPGVTGYKWNTNNNYSTATDMGSGLIKTETGLTPGTSYMRYVWTYNICGMSTVTILTQNTLSCGSSFTINHLAGAVAPVTKTVTYATVSNIPGETSKCWITSNLGSDHQAAAVNDATEPSAGWYWEFNRMQGYKHDGTNRTPGSTWIDPIDENLDWQAANDPCALELGGSWRIPSSTEWTNVDASGGWTDWNGPWGSGLKLHAAGLIDAGGFLLYSRGEQGHYWSSTQEFTAYSNYFFLSSFGSQMASNDKTYGYTLRCLKDVPDLTTTSVTNVTQTTATSGGNVISDGGFGVSARGVCWSTSQYPTFSDSHTTDGSGTGVFISAISRLTLHTTYYVRAYAINSEGTSYGNQVTFTTTVLNPILPTVTTTAATNITTTTVTSGGNVTSDGGASVTARGVCWSTSSNPTLANNITTDGSGTGVFVSNLTGLNPNTLYYVKAYATNSMGTTYGDEVSFTTLPVGFTCGSSLPINHLASGGVAPVDKTVAYGTVTNIPGELTKCWITSNLGASQQAIGKDDNTEASAGWYWQFNCQQGYQYTTTRTPNTTWITSIDENLDWQAANDPCAHELGTGWRIPSSTEWTNVDASGAWTDWNGPWSSALKIHAAGYLSNTTGALAYRGSYGRYWSSNQYTTTANGLFLTFTSSANSCYVFNRAKASGFSMRCIRE